MPLGFFGESIDERTDHQAAQRWKQYQIGRTEDRQRLGDVLTDEVRDRVQYEDEAHRAEPGEQAGHDGEDDQVVLRGQEGRSEPDHRPAERRLTRHGLAAQASHRAQPAPQPRREALNPSNKGAGLKGRLLNSG